MIIGLSGTHGTGKSTIVQRLKYSNLDNVKVVESQLSRKAQHDLGWERLSEAGESVEKMWQLQEMILGALYDRDKNVDNSLTNIVERTPADIWAYTVMWCIKFNIDYTKDPHAIDYKHRCQELINSYDLHLVVPQNAAVPFVYDPNRADADTRDFVEDTIYDFLNRNSIKYHTIFETSKDGRASEATRVIFNLRNNNG